MPLKTVIVEDEPLSRAFLHNLLREYCPQVKVVADVATATEAIETIRAIKPDLVFMDIELQQGTGFDVLKATHDCGYHVIFTTAIEHNGIRAIKFSGADYLQKPIDIQGLQSCIEQIDTGSCRASEGLNHLVETLNNNNVPIHIVTNTPKGIVYPVIRDIISIEARESDCVFRIDKAEPVIAIGKTLKEYEQLLEDYGFMRVHHAFVVNLAQIKGGSKLETGSVVMNDGSVVGVSEKKIGELNARIENRKS